MGHKSFLNSQSVSFCSWSACLYLHIVITLRRHMVRVESVINATVKYVFISLQFVTRSVRTTWWICAPKSSVRQSRRCTHEELTCRTCVRCASLPRSGLVSSSPRLSLNSSPTSACPRVQSARASAAASMSASAFRFDTTLVFLFIVGMSTLCDLVV